MPFYLDEVAEHWVDETLESLTLDEKIGQVLLPLRRDVSDRARLDEIVELGVGGVYRTTDSTPEQLRESARYLQNLSRVPLLLPADLEFDEGRAVGGPAGTQLPNQLTVAATGDPAWARELALIAAREARWCGYNWTFTPVVDIDLNPDNPLVNTRSYGSDAQTVIDFAVAYVEALQEEGMAACAKHWPGDGVDDRDQHLVTTVNSMDLEDWQASYGAVYRALIASGVRTIMSAHIAFPTYVRARQGSEAAAQSAVYRPATLSRELNVDLLRGELGYRGLIVSDASEMAGFTSQGPRAELVPQCIENGCDILLFNQPDDKSHLQAGLERGLLSMSRLDEAVRHVLELKASLGLHRDAGPWGEDAGHGPLASSHARVAEQIAEAAVTLIRDEQDLLPLSPATRRRLLIITEPSRANVLGPLPALQVPQQLKKAGFDVTMYDSDTLVDPGRFDALLYVVAHEAKQGKVHLRLRWDQLHGRFPRLMERHWHTLPTAFVSLGNPYHAYEVPQCPTIVNAYSPAQPVQEAVVKALTGRIPFAGVSPVDPLAGLADGEFER